VLFGSSRHLADLYSDPFRVEDPKRNMGSTP